MTDSTQTTDLIEHLRKKMLAAAEGACSLQDGEVIRLSQLLDRHLVALMRPAPRVDAPEEGDLPPAAGEGHPLVLPHALGYRRRFRVIGRAVDTPGLS